MARAIWREPTNIHDAFQLMLMNPIIAPKGKPVAIDASPEPGEWLATHWNIGDGSAAFVAARFYQAWREERCAPTEALRRAQRWVRHATREELNAYLPGILPQTDSPSAVNAHVRLTTAPVAAERPFAQPRSWAPFSLTGV